MEILGKVRLNKEIKLDCCDGIELKYGTTNKDNPKVVYISGKMWIKPNSKGDYGTIINSIKKNFKNNIKRILNNNVTFDTRYISDFDINPDNLEYGKKTYVYVCLFVRQKKVEITKLKNMKNVILHNFKYLFKDLEKELHDNYFDVSKEKADVDR